MDIKEFAFKPVKLVSGQKSCEGCGIPIILRQVMASTDYPLVIGQGTGCIVVVTSTYPHNSWNVPTIHTAFACLGAATSGAEAAYRILKKKGKVKKEIKFIAFGGDGGSYDIGLQSLSGAVERQHDMVYICYDNEFYANTGSQKSSATPYGAATSTTPVGKKLKGKMFFRKNLTQIMAAHDIPYVAQASIANFQDLTMKAKKAIEMKGPAFLNILSPCTLFWKIDTGITQHISKLAVDTNFWPLYEVENGVYKLNYKPFKVLPVVEFLKPQGRFKHLFKPENKQMIDQLQNHVNKEWKKLLKLCGENEKEKTRNTT